MIKKVLFVLILLILENASGQDIIAIQGQQLSKNAFMNGATIYNPPKQLIGTPYLFKDWKNINYVYLKNGDEKQVAMMESININIQLNKFTTKIENKTIYNFNQDYFNYVMINNRRFEFFYDMSTNSKRIFEIISDFGDKKLIKGYETYIIDGENRGFETSNPDSRLKIKEYYYIKKGDKISPIKLKKKSLLALMSDKEKEVSSFMKKEKLSYRKEKDIRTIFRYYNSL